MGGSAEEARARAEAKFQKQQQADQQAAVAKAEREVQAQAVDVNTARLKSLRLAKEAADKDVAAQTKAGPHLALRQQSVRCRLAPDAFSRKMSRSSTPALVRASS
jgi:hypothetical protein